MRSTAQALRRAYEAMPAPKLVFAIGSCACGGGIWFDTYSVMGGVEKVVPVDFCIPGCPPRPEAILHGVAVALGILGKTVVAREPLAQPVFPFPRYQPCPAQRGRPSRSRARKPDRQVEPRRRRSARGAPRPRWTCRAVGPQRAFSLRPEMACPGRKSVVAP